MSGMEETRNAYRIVVKKSIVTREKPVRVWKKTHYDGSWGSRLWGWKVDGTGSESCQLSVLVLVNFLALPESQVNHS
jgi:hypothetical protein